LPSTKNGSKPTESAARMQGLSSFKAHLSHFFSKYGRKYRR